MLHTRFDSIVMDILRQTLGQDIAEPEEGQIQYFPFYSKGLLPHAQQFIRSMVQFMHG